MFVTGDRTACSQLVTMSRRVHKEPAAAATDAAAASGRRAGDPFDWRDAK